MQSRPSTRDRSRDVLESSRLTPFPSAAAPAAGLQPQQPALLTDSLNSTSLNASIYLTMTPLSSRIMAHPVLGPQSRATGPICCRSDSRRVCCARRSSIAETNERNVSLAPERRRGLSLPTLTHQPSKLAARVRFPPPAFLYGGRRSGNPILSTYFDIRRAGAQGESEKICGR
jgi:hypothetical protein